MRRIYNTSAGILPNSITDQRLTRPGRPTNGGLSRSSGYFPRGLHLLVLLERPHARVRAASKEQLCMGTAFDDAAAFQHENLVSGDDGREPVRDHQRRSVDRYLLELRLDELLGLGVER